MLFLKQSHIFSFLFHKSATTGYKDSNNVLNSKLKPDLNSIDDCPKDGGKNFFNQDALCSDYEP